MSTNDAVFPTDEYAASGMIQNKRGRYLYKDELVRMIYDPLRGFGATNPLGTVDVMIQRYSTGGIAEITAYHEGDEVYDRYTKEFGGDS